MIIHTHTHTHTPYIFTHTHTPTHTPTYTWPQWMQLNSRKASMRRLFKRMRDYQFEKMREQPDKALTEDTRPITEEDFTR